MSFVFWTFDHSDRPILETSLLLILVISVFNKSELSLHRHLPGQILFVYISQRRQNLARGF
jgi:hypothetical protein